MHPAQTRKTSALRYTTPVIALVKETASHWISDEAPRLSAALSYYTVFSLAPLLLLSVAVGDTTSVP